MDNLLEKLCTFLTILHSNPNRFHRVQLVWNKLDYVVVVLYWDERTHLEHARCYKSDGSYEEV